MLLVQKNNVYQVDTQFFFTSSTEHSIINIQVDTINLNIGNTVLQQVEFSKYLGVILILILAGNIILISFIIKSLNSPVSFTRYEIC